MDRIRGGLYGLLIGDALGVPYEFYSRKDLPSKKELEMIPPAFFQKSYPEVPEGTWSDDGAQALCLLESLVECGEFQLSHFADKLLEWSNYGKWAIDNIVFDIGMQTGRALIAYGKGISPEESGNCEPEGKGNGALMRVLPLALWHKGSDLEMVLDAQKQCLVTHSHRCNQVCCALYCLVARELLSGKPFINAYQNAVSKLHMIYQTMPLYEQELEWSFRPKEPLIGKGTGYVIDCLRSAFMIMENADSYESAVKDAVALGNDTDTTACVTGGLAGIHFGFEAIPERWIMMLRGKELVETRFLSFLESKRT